MFKQPSKIQMLLLGQLSILLISLVSTLFPGYYFLVAIAYAVVIAAVFSYSARKMSKKPSKEELGRPIFRENNAIKIAMFDKELHDELVKQMKATMLSMSTFILVLILFPLYRAVIAPYISSALESIITDSILVTFLNFLFMYEFIFVLMTIIRIIITKKYKFTQIMLPQRYIVYRKGVIINDRFYTPFSEDYCYKYDPKRHFIEIVSLKNPNFRLRLYSENITKLKESIDNENLLRLCEER